MFSDSSERSRCHGCIFYKKLVPERQNFPLNSFKIERISPKKGEFSPKSILICLEFLKILNMPTVPWAQSPNTNKLEYTAMPSMYCTGDDDAGSAWWSLISLTVRGRTLPANNPGLSSLRSSVQIGGNWYFMQTAWLPLLLLLLPSLHQAYCLHKLW